MATSELIKKLGEVGEYVNGRAFKPSEWGNTGLPIIRIQNLNNEAREFNYCITKVESRYHVYDGDILISWSASLGVYVWNRGEALLNQHIFKVILNELNIDKKYFVYVIQTRLEEMSSKTHGATMRHIVRHKFLDIEIPVPPLDEQKRIVAKLEKVLGKIKEAKRLRAEAQALTTSLLPAELHKIFEEGKKKGWEVVAVEDVCEHPQYGFTASSTRDNVGPKFLRITDIQDGKVDWKTVPYCMCKAVKKYQLQQGDLVFARTGATVGKSFLLGEVPTEVIFASYLIRLRAKDSILAEYLYYFFQSPDYWGQISEGQVGGAQPNVNGSKLAKLKIPLPPIPEQRRFVVHLDALSEKIRAIQSHQAQTALDLTALEKSVLHMAFSAELV